MIRKINVFIKNYIEAIEGSDAAIFAGAGLSKPAGYVDWKGLMKDFAEELGLDIKIENDLVAIAQYYVNENSRYKVNEKIFNEFRQRDFTENHKILASLPIYTFWTTNYDNLIENALEKQGKIVDIKNTSESFNNTLANTDCVVYKMHGDVSLPQEAVLTKDDYEGYNINRQVFSDALIGDLGKKTFLFIGFGFDDPNLAHILSRIRTLLGTNRRPQYCIMKKLEKSEYNSNQEYAYANIKQELKIKDLKRYNIDVLLVESYNQITEILQFINNSVKRRNIFVSGSCKYFDNWTQEEAFKFSTSLSRIIIKEKFNIVTGFGVGIGSCIISGALQELYTNNEKQVNERLIAKPFPQNSDIDSKVSQSLWPKYREEMISNVGISIFIFGNKDDDKGNRVLSDGMMSEYKISLEKGSIPVPVGATGDVSREIWEDVMRNFEKYVGIPSLKCHYEALGDTSASQESLLESIKNIINGLRNIQYEFYDGKEL